MVKEYKIRDFLKRIKTQVEVEDGCSYKRLTIRTNHQRDIADGSLIGTKSQFIVNGGDFILSKIDARYGAFGIIPLELDGAIITGNFWTYKVDTDLVDTEWFFYFTHSYSFIQICQESSTGTTHRKYLDEKMFLNHKILLPEKKEQVQMVKRYLESSKISNECVKEIKSQKKILSQLKQSILQEAIEGKLTEAWREQNPDVKPASEILQLIKAEKEQLIKDGKIKKEKPLPPISENEVPFVLPEGWIWCRLGEICDNITAGSTPSQDSFISKEIPYLKVYNIRNQKIDFHYKPQFIKKNVHETSLKRCILKPGDVIMNIVGPPLGKVAIIPNDYPEWNCNQAIAIFRCIDNEINEYLYLYLSTGIYLKTLDFKGMAGQDNISVTMCKNLLLPLPPKEEQKTILHKLKTLLEKKQALETEITQSEQHAQKLMQAVLKEAFMPVQTPEQVAEPEWEEQEISQYITSEI